MVMKVILRTGERRGKFKSHRGPNKIRMFIRICAFLANNVVDLGKFDAILGHPVNGGTFYHLSSQAFPLPFFDGNFFLGSVQRWIFPWDSSFTNQARQPHPYNSLS